MLEPPVYTGFRRFAISRLAVVFTGRAKRVAGLRSISRDRRSTNGTQENEATLRRR
jgi:hypothetical protein